MLYTCEKCRFVFDTPITGSTKLYCPDCGSALIRPSTEFEKERYHKEKTERYCVNVFDVPCLNHWKDTTSPDPDFIARLEELEYK